MQVLKKEKKQQAQKAMTSYNRSILYKTVFLSVYIIGWATLNALGIILNFASTYTK